MSSLFCVATPIGNLQDMTPRAITTLKAVGLIAAEDTRVTQRLLSTFDIHVPITSYHEHNERGKAERLVERMLSENMDVALVTDAGTPCISDPGSILVREAAQKGIEVIAIPGPTAMAAALSVSGFSAREFTFYGFLPRVRNELKCKLMEMATRSQLAIVHESPHRVIALLSCILEVLPHTSVSVSCDLTKRYELTLRGTVSHVLSALKENPKAEKGEYCLVLCWDERDVPAPVTESNISLEARLMDAMMNGLPIREAMHTLVQTGEKKNAVYAASLHVKSWLQEQTEAL